MEYGLIYRQDDWGLFRDPIGDIKVVVFVDQSHFVSVGPVARIGNLDIFRAVELAAMKRSNPNWDSWAAFAIAHNPAIAVK